MLPSPTSIEQLLAFKQIKEEKSLFELRFSECLLNYPHLIPDNMQRFFPLQIAQCQRAGAATHLPSLSFQIECLTSLCSGPWSH